MRILISAAGGLGALVVGVALYGYYDFTRNFHLPLTGQQISNAEIAFKGAMGEAIFEGHHLRAELVPTEKLKNKGGLDALLASAPAANQGQGLIDAYQKDPQKFKRYADMFDTAMNATKVGDVVLRQRRSHPPRTSEPLQMEADVKVDAWGSPFCIIPLGEKVAVVSGGPSRLSCDALPVTPEQIGKSNRNVYAGPSDVVVVIATRSQQPGN